MVVYTLKSNAKDEYRGKQDGYARTAILKKTICDTKVFETIYRVVEMMFAGASGDAC